MQIVIDIPDTAYRGIIKADHAGGDWSDDLLGVLCRGVANGTPLPKGHGDLIDRKKLLHEAQADGAYGYVSACEIHDAETIIAAEEVYDRVDTREKTGHWIDVKDKNGNWRHKCSSCNQIYDIDFRRAEANIVDNYYCPKCGCRMVEPRESEVRNDIQRKYNGNT